MVFKTTAPERAELEKFGITTYPELRRHIHSHPESCLYGLFKRVSFAFHRTAA